MSFRIVERSDSKIEAETIMVIFYYHIKIRYNNGDLFSLQYLIKIYLSVSGHSDHHQSKQPQKPCDNSFIKKHIMFSLDWFVIVLMKTSQRKFRNSYISYFEKQLKKALHLVFGMFEVSLC